MVIARPRSRYLHDFAYSEAVRRIVVGACPLCGGRRDETVLALGDPTGAVAGDFTYHRCTDCRAFWLADPPSPEDIGAAYSEGYYSFHLSDRTGWMSGLDRVGAGLVTARFGAGPLRMFGRFLPGYPVLHRVGVVVDVGCGDGTRVARLRDAGWCAVGIDPGAVRPRGGLWLVCASGEQLPLPDAVADAVVASHSIEHTYNPRQMVREINRILKPGGEAVVLTPNTASMSRHVFGRYWRAWDAPRHLVLLATPQLVRLLGEEGFQIGRVRGSSNGNYWVESVLVRGRGVVTERPGRVQLAALILARAFAALTNWLPGTDEVEVLAVKRQ
jgi:SAM-dependent methyltransferase